jgi:hypothetical protein
MFIEQQAFSRSCDLAPPLFCQQDRPAMHRKTEKERQLAVDEKERGKGVKPNQEKAWSSINLSILSAPSVIKFL